VPAGLDVLVDADLFVDGAFVARQRHDFAEFGDAFQQFQGAAVDAGRGEADFRCDECRFGNVELGCDVALAHLRILGTESADVGRCRLGVLGHVLTPTYSELVCPGG
jgi:hypothetical protein